MVDARQRMGSGACAVQGCPYPFDRGNEFCRVHRPGNVSKGNLVLLSTLKVAPRAWPWGRRLRCGLIWGHKPPRSSLDPAP